MHETEKLKCNLKNKTNQAYYAMTVVKVFGKLKRSKLALTLLALFVIHALFSALSAPEISVEPVQKHTPIEALEPVESAENIFKEPEVPSLITFDLHDVLNYIKSFFQDHESLLRAKLRSYSQYLGSQAAKPMAINRFSEIEVDHFSRDDYAVAVPEIYLNRYSRLDETLPLVTNYDIRFTLAVYFRHIRAQIEGGEPPAEVAVPFHWYDWVDITAVNKHVLFHNDPYIPAADKLRYSCEYVSTNLVRNFGDHGEDRLVRNEIRYDPKTFCRDHAGLRDLAADYSQNNGSGINFNVFKWTRKSLIRAKMLQSRSYLYAGAPTPVSVVFLVDLDVPAGSDMRARLDSVRVFEFPVQNGGTVGHARKILEGYDALVEPLLAEHKLEIAGLVLRVNPLDELARLVDVVPRDAFSEPESTGHQLDLDALELKLSSAGFEYDAKAAVAEYEKALGDVDWGAANASETLRLRKQQNHRDSLKYSARTRPAKVRKHFHEVPIAPAANEGLRQLEKAGGHYDWRFFNGIVQSELETRRTLHHLVRLFLKFTYARRFAVWVAHGSLLSWYWNGSNFPWDYDVDVQMPIKDLQQFCLLYNNTLVVENLGDGLGKYFVDCGSSLTHREKGYGRNNIDARFIDIDKGIYIDITGLALTSTQLPKKYISLRRRDVEASNGVVTKEGLKYPFALDSAADDDDDDDDKLKATPNQIVPARIDTTYKDGLTPAQRYNKNARLQIYSCKNEHFAFYHNLSPLRMTLIEGTVGFVPHNHRDIIKDEYYGTALSTQYFAKHFFLTQLRIWVPTYKFRNFFKWLITEHGEKRFSKSLSKNLYAIDNDVNDLLRFLEFDETVLLMYYLTQRYTKEHQLEMEQINRGASTKDILESSLEFKPMLKDSFLYMRNDLNKDIQKLTEEQMYDSVKGTLQMDQMTGDEEEAEPGSEVVEAPVEPVEEISEVGTEASLA